MRMLWLFSVCSEFQAPPRGLEYELQHLSRSQWIRVDANILETITRKTEEKKIVLLHVHMACVSYLVSSSSLVNPLFMTSIVELWHSNP